MIAAAGFYAIALLFELLRFIRHLNVAYPAPSSFAAFGLGCHAVTLGFLHIVAKQPIGGAEMFFFSSAWGLVLIYVLWTLYYPNIPFGLILLPLALLLMSGGLRLTSAAAESILPSRSLAKMLHAVPAAGVMVALSIASICCACYFLESYLLHKKRALPDPIQLPSLEWSLSVCRLSSIVAVVCLCLCVLGGIVLNINRHVTSLWLDPLVIGALCLFIVLFLGPLKWLFLSHRTTESRSVFMLIVFAYIIFLSILMIALASNNVHWNKPPPIIPLSSSQRFISN